MSWGERAGDGEGRKGDVTGRTKSGKAKGKIQRTGENPNRRDIREDGQVENSKEGIRDGGQQGSGITQI